MRHTLNKFGLLWLCLLLSVFAVKSIVNAADLGVTIDRLYPARVWYKSVLHTLNLWELWGTTATLKATDWKLKFTNWLVVWNASNVGNSQYAVIGGGNGNKILNNKDYAGIWWGGSNEASAKYAVIWWGNTNKANWENAVVVGWDHNTSAGWSVVVWWKWNSAVDGGIVLWWEGNTWRPNSLALGKNATSNEGSFAWNWTASEDSAYINASNGTLINTTTPIAWVNLVVDGAVKVEWNTTDAWVYWEIRYVGGCFYWYDGSKWHVMNRWNDKNNNNECGAFPGTTAKFCYFGNTILWDSDTAIAYKNPYSTNCNASTNRKTVTCINWSLSPSWYTHPYCYPIHAN